MRKSWELVTLCSRCEEDYRDLGRNIKHDTKTKLIDRCEMCGKLGLTLFIKRKRTPNRKPDNENA